MNKEEFLRQLEGLLSGISEEERADAMAFYRSYFEDAGEENEASILAELESPQKVAESILKNLGIDGSNGYYNTFANRDAAYYRNVSETAQSIGSEPKKGGAGAGFGILIAVITSPIWLTVLLVILSVLLALVAALFGLTVAVVAVMASLLIVGVVLFGVGGSLLFGGSPAVGIGLMGGGLVVLALGLLAVILVVWVVGAFLPWAIGGIVRLCRKPFVNRKERIV